MTQIIGFAVEYLRALLGPGAAEERGDSAFRQIDVSLRFDERDRRDGERAVSIDDRVTRVLPTLVAQPFLRLTVVLDVAVAVTVAILRDPVERRLDVSFEFEIGRASCREMV